MARSCIVPKAQVLSTENSPYTMQGVFLCLLVPCGHTWPLIEVFAGRKHLQCGFIFIIELTYISGLKQKAVQLKLDICSIKCLCVINISFDVSCCVDWKRYLF